MMFYPIGYIDLKITSRGSGSEYFYAVRVPWLIGEIRS